MQLSINPCQNYVDNAKELKLRASDIHTTFMKDFFGINIAVIKLKNLVISNLYHVTTKWKCVYKKNGILKCSLLLK